MSDYISAAKATVAGNGTSTEEPCAQVSSVLAKTNSTTLDASLALKCLQSVPLDSEGDSLQLLGLSSFFQFQSTLAYLKDPTPGYLYPPVDILAEMGVLSSSLQNGAYTNEYDLQLDIYKLIRRAYDGHFQYIADITDVFAFIRGIDLVSVSKDGLSLPEVYVDSDIALLANATNNSTASPVVRINGQDVEVFLNNIASAGSSQDPDTNYNSVFVTLPDQDLWHGSRLYQGTDTVLQFQNGSIRHILTVANTLKDFTGVTDGMSFFQKFCSGPSSAAPSQSAATSSAAPTGISTEVSYSAVPSQTAIPAPSAFPKPWVIASDLSIACYFPTENDDLAVLSVPTFSPPSKNVIQFSDITRECLATASKLGKTKLVIDLRGNPGGEVFLGFDMFKQLFPSIEPWGASNFRAFPLFDEIGQIVTQFYQNVTSENAGREGMMVDFSSPFNENEEFNSMEEPFTSWSDFYGPVTVHDDNFTELVRFNLSDPYQTQGQPISGYGNLTGIVPKQTFAAQDIVLVYDGFCGSTCAVFSEFMKSQGHVGSVVFGGRKQAGPMQAVGSVKGANVYSFSILIAMALEAYKDAPKSKQEQIQRQYGQAFKGVAQAIKRATFDPTLGGASATVNIRNNIRQNDTTLTPLQFVYEAADCRLFYTAEQISDQALVWSAAYNAYWMNGSCVEGSTDQPSSQPGTSYILSPPGVNGTTASSTATSSGTGGPVSATANEANGGFGQIAMLGAIPALVAGLVSA